MTDRGRVVIDLTETEDSQFGFVPDSRFITPSDESGSDSDSDDNVQVLWDTRKKKNDAQTQTLRSDQSKRAISRNASIQQSRQSSVTQSHRLSAALTQSSLPPSNAPASVSATHHGNAAPVRPSPNLNKRPSIHPPVQRSHTSTQPALQSHAPPQPMNHGPSHPARFARPPLPNKPVSILSPGTRQWLAGIQAQRFDTAIPSQPPPHPAPAINSFSRVQPRVAPTLPSAPSRQAAVPTPDPPITSVQKRPTPAHQSEQRHQRSITSVTPVATTSGRVQAPPQVQKPSTPSLGPTRQPPVPSQKTSVSTLPHASTQAQEPTIRASSAESFATVVSLSSSSDSADVPVPLETSPAKRKPDSDNDDGISRVKRLRRRESPARPSSASEFSLAQATSSEPSDEPIQSVETADTVQRPRFAFPNDLSKIKAFPYTQGKPFTEKEDALIQFLKDIKQIPWKDFERFFPGRRWQSLQSRYSTHLSPRALERRGTSSYVLTSKAQASAIRSLTRQENSMLDVDMVRETRLKTRERNHLDHDVASEEKTPDLADESHCKRVTSSLSSLIRHREMGATRGREWPRRFHAEVKDYAYKTMGPQAYMDNASGDVSTVAWSPDGKFFAAGAVAVTDPQSIQYNKPKNLLIGNAAGLSGKELPEHKIRHHLEDGSYKDLFSTVQMVGFSPDSSHMYSVSIDKRLNVYKINGSVSNTILVDSIKHPGPVDFLTINSAGLVATGCTLSGPKAIRVLGSNASSIYLSGTNATPQTKKYPSALKWGQASHHSHLLLAGFSCEAEVFYAEDEQRDKEGEVCLWDLAAQRSYDVGAPKCNVFDVAWNPNPSSASSVFAVASGARGKVNQGMHSVVRLYSPKEHDSSSARCLIELECPAWDINDVIYSPHDDNIITVGSTEGRVYLWDLRYVKESQEPLRTFKHGESLAILPHEKKRWEADTGIRFLSWGEGRDRMYSGSSDGVVKCWDPYRSDEDKHVRDVARLKSAIMSGGFSPDHSSLLIGEDQARLNLLTIGNEGAKFTMATKRFAVQEAPLAEEAEANPIDCEKLLASGALEIRPAGTMPFRQVVQGAGYDGPFLKDASAARSRDEAQRFQEKALRMLRRRNKQLRRTGHVGEEPCRLDCAHKPLPENEREENGRSDDRIPDRLWQWTAAGQAGRMLGLLATCSGCGGAARLRDETGEVLCEKCEFACFRCGQAASVSPRGRAIECASCGLAWKIGALGYELIEDGRAAKEVKRKGMMTQICREMEDVDGELGESERDFFLQDLSDDTSDSSIPAGF